MLSYSQDMYAERRYIPAELFPSPSGMTIFRDRIAIGSFVGKVGGVIIESAEMADMMRRLFELAWRGAEHTSIESESAERDARVKSR